MQHKHRNIRDTPNHQQTQRPPTPSQPPPSHPLALLQVFLLRGISAVTHPDIVKEKLDRPWIRSVLACALREHDGMRRWPDK